MEIDSITAAFLSPFARYLALDLEQNSELLHPMILYITSHPNSWNDHERVKLLEK